MATKKMTMKKWENSAEDKKLDKKAVNAYNNKLAKASSKKK